MCSHLVLPPACYDRYFAERSLEVCVSALASRVVQDVRILRRFATADRSRSEPSDVASNLIELSAGMVKIARTDQRRTVLLLATRASKRNSPSKTIGRAVNARFDSSVPSMEISHAN